MNFQTTAGRVVNRNWFRFVADETGVISTDIEEVATIFANMGFESLDKVEKVVEPTKTKKNAKIQ
jgi:adenylate cyclase class IV